MTITDKMTDEQYELLKDDIANHIAEPLCQLIDSEDEYTLDEFQCALKDLAEGIYDTIYDLWTNPSSTTRNFTCDWDSCFTQALFQVTYDIK